MLLPFYPPFSSFRLLIWYLVAQLVGMGATPPQERTARTDEHVMTRQQRAHWRFSWEQRLARHARPVTAPSLTITIHGLSASFAHISAFDLLTAA